MVKNSRELYNEFLSNYQHNPMLAPKLRGIVVSSGCGRFSKNQNILESRYNDLMKICAQKPVYSKAKKSISNFGIREKYTVGMYATLRSHQMFDFLDRLIKVALPRVQDLQLLSLKSFDNDNNYNFGIKRQDIFPEIDNTSDFFGMNICIKLNAQNRDDAINLLRFLGLPMQERAVKEGVSNAN